MTVTRRREGGTMEHHPQSHDERIAAFRQVVEEKAYAKIDGIMIDMFTANCVFQVYDALNETNQQRFASRNARHMAHVAFTIIEKNNV